MDAPNIRQRPELIFSLTGAVGTDLDIVCSSISRLLTEMNYRCQIIQLSQLLKDCAKEGWEPLIESPEEERTNSYMTRGNHLRESLCRGDALAILSIASIQKHREESTKDKGVTLPRFAFILKSLKNPDELRSLREIYGSNLIALSIYSSRESRIQRLTKKIADSRHVSKIVEFRATAEQLIQRDEAEEQNRYGQNVRETFPLADVFIDNTDKADMERSLQRFLELLFNHPFHTPTRNECAMAQAYISALRSSSMARQVGAAIVNQQCDLLAIGTNDVPSAQGGLYWCGDSGDARDFQFEVDASDTLRMNLLGEIIDKMKKVGWFSEAIKKTETKQLLSEALIEGDPPPFRKSQLMDVIEYGRAVHAEMAAISSAANRGISIKGCNLYTTTFPCHECAKHIVASGLQRVYYIEPYPKSLVIELYSDSIAINGDSDKPDKVQFIPFDGVAPRLYMKLFLGDKKRKKKLGEIPKWDKKSAEPIVLDNASLNVLLNEYRAIYEIYKLMEGVGISFQKGGQ